MADRNTVNQTENNMQGNNTNPAANRENVPDGSMTIGNTGEVTAARGGSVSKELREHREGRNADVKINIVKNDGVVVGYMVINEYSEAGRVSHITAKQSFDGHIETATFDVNFIDVSQACRYTDIGLFLSALCVENLKETDLYQKLINYIDRIYSLSGLNLGDDIKNSIISACISGLRQSGGKLLRERNYLGSALMAKSLIEGCRKINLDAPVENKGNHADNAGVKDKNTPTPQGNNTTDQKPQGNNTADQTPQGNNTANQTPQGNNTADQTPQGNNTANQTLQGNNTANQTLQGNNTANQTAQREKTLDEYKKDDGNFHRASINRVERYLRGKGKKDFFVFLSAVTTCLDAEGKPKKTLEYDIAVKLHKLLKSRGIGSFWWEDSKLPTDWYISAKIATGLVTSSVFVGLAFDTAVLDKGNKYIYKCLNEKENVPNCFFYEFETFRSFCSNKTGENKDSNVEQFVKPFKSVLPSKRHQLFFVPDDERAIDFDESVFNNKDILQRISFSNDDSQKENIVIQILAKIGQILFFNKKEYKDANRSWKRSDHFRRNNAGISEEEWFSTLTAEERKFVSANIYNDDKETMELFAPLDVKDDKDLTEDTCAVSSDYFFEYSIVNKDGQNAKKQFTLFPRQGQDRNGNIIWELCAVIKDWSYAQVDADDILSRTHQQKLTAEERNNLTEKYKLLGFDEVTIYSDTEKIKTIKRAEYLNRGIAEFAIDMGSTNGRLVFRQNGKGAVKEYYFFVDFFYKKIRYYKLRKKPFSNSSEIVMLSKDKIPVKVDVRRHQSNMAIFRDSQLYLGMSGVTIGNGDRIKVERSGEYCLVPSGKDKAYYLFLQNNPIKGKDLPIKSKKLRCPYCGRFLSDSRTKANNPDYCVPRVDGDKFFCTHNFIYKFFAPMELGGITTKDFSPTDGKALGPKLEEFDREIQNNTSLQIRLPDKIDSGAIISLVGISKSGKSTFISELFSSQNQDDSFIVSSPIASKIPGCI
ncbi:MAG: hypothetical protein ACI4QI_06710, partial [Candidatus Coproplasma sp.]